MTARFSGYISPKARAEVDRGGGLRSFDRFRCLGSEESVCSAARRECETELKP